MDLGSLLKEKLGGAKGDADMSEESAFDRLYDALKDGDRDGARDAFEHAVYEHQMAMDDEDDEDIVDDDEEAGGVLLAMSPKRTMTSDSRMKKSRKSDANRKARRYGSELDRLGSETDRKLDRKKKRSRGRDGVRSGTNFTESRGKFLRTENEGT